MMDTKPPFEVSQDPPSVSLDIENTTSTDRKQTTDPSQDFHYISTGIDHTMSSEIKPFIDPLQEWETYKMNLIAECQKIL